MGLSFGARPTQQFNFKCDSKTRGSKGASGLSLLKGNSASEKQRGRGQQSSKGAESADNET